MCIGYVYVLKKTPPIVPLQFEPKLLQNSCDAADKVKVGIVKT